MSLERGTRMLIRLPNWVGDTLLALPALEGLCASGAERLAWAGREPALALTRHLAPGQPRVLLGARTRAAAWAGEAARLHSLGCRRALLLTPSFSSAAQAWAAGIRERSGWSEQGRRLWLTHPAARSPRGSLHLCEEFKDLARLAGARDFPSHPRLPADPLAASAARSFLEAAGPEALADDPRPRPAEPGSGEPLVALCPGARYGAAKQWPLERFAELGQALVAERGARLLVVGGREEQLVGERLAASLPAGRCRSAAGRGGLAFSAELLRRCAAAVCNDSGAMHLAAAVGTPVVALFGPTDPRWSGPLGERHQIVRAECLCAPCFARECALGPAPAPCMAAIRPRDVLRRVAALLDPAGDPAPPALFLDRDGTLIEPVPYLHDPAAVRLVSGAAGALRRARSAGYRIVVVSNQSGVARGYFGAAEVEAVHAALRAQLAAEGIEIERLYYCPHHPDHGGPCQCRKPAPGMLLQAARELPVDLARSTMIGDTVADARAGAAAGCASVLVRTGHGESERREGGARLPAGTLVAGDLAEAVALILVRKR